MFFKLLELKHSLRFSLLPALNRFFSSAASFYLRSSSYFFHFLATYSRAPVEFPPTLFASIKALPLILRISFLIKS
jgi:hypothetical protein